MGALVNSSAGRLGVAIENMTDVGRMTMWLMEQKWVTPKACLVVSGRSARAFEFRRPLFAALNQ
eukprot:4451444-Pyramimonas_sp.AAC.1